MLKRIFHSAVTAYVLLVVLVVFGQFTAHRIEQRDIHRNCVATQHEWDTFQHLIVAAVHPPSRAGQKLTADQKAALVEYRIGLINAVGDRPQC